MAKQPELKLPAQAPSTRHLSKHSNSRCVGSPHRWRVCRIMFQVSGKLNFPPPPPPAPPPPPRLLWCATEKTMYISVVAHELLPKCFSICTGLHIAMSKSVGYVTKQRLDRRHAAGSCKLALVASCKRGKAMAVVQEPAQEAPRQLFKYLPGAQWASAD